MLHGFNLTFCRKRSDGQGKNFWAFEHKSLRGLLEFYIFNHSWAVGWRFWLYQFSAELRRELWWGFWGVLLESESLFVLFHLLLGFMSKCQTCWTTSPVESATMITMITMNTMNTNHVNLLNNFSSGECDHPASARGWVFHQGAGARLVRMIVIIMIIIMGHGSSDCSLKSLSAT